jgi:endonuclease/exonuclease/phosphatase (EEP) superfamily protein YafD
MYRSYLPWYVDQSQRVVACKSPKVSEKLGGKIVMLNWNVHKNNHSVRWLEDFSGILLHYRPDLILFQEYRTMNRKSVLDKHMEYGYGFFPNIIYKQHHYGLVNASRADMIAVNSYTTPDVEPFVRTPKVMLETIYETKAGGSVRVINVHMINFVRIRKFLAQIAQIERVFQKDDMPLILSGDFNTWNRRRMHILQKLAYEHDLRDVRFSSQKHRKPPFPYPLDHVFYRGLDLEKAEVLDEIVTSDHKPLLVTFGAK